LWYDERFTCDLLAEALGFITSGSKPNISAIASKANYLDLPKRATLRGKKTDSEIRIGAMRAEKALEPREKYELSELLVLEKITPKKWRITYENNFYDYTPGVWNEGSTTALKSLWYDPRFTLRLLGEALGFRKPDLTVSISAVANKAVREKLPNRETLRDDRTDGNERAINNDDKMPAMKPNYGAKCTLSPLASLTFDPPAETAALPVSESVMEDLARPAFFVPPPLLNPLHSYFDDDSRICTWTEPKIGVQGMWLRCTAALRGREGIKAASQSNGAIV
jgi:hypothetical protein